MPELQQMFTFLQTRIANVPAPLLPTRNKFYTRILLKQHSILGRTRDGSTTRMRMLEIEMQQN